MRSSASEHIRSNVVGYVALFFALSGSAMAVGSADERAPFPPPDGIRNKQIATGAVNSRTLRDHSVERQDLVKNSVQSGKIVDGSIKGKDVADDSLTGDQIDESTLDPAILQFRLDGGCPAGQAIRTVAANGATTCESTGTGTLTEITTAGGLTGGGNSGSVNVGVDPTQLQSRVGGDCTGNNAIQAVAEDGTVTCQPTGTGTVTSVGAGTGLSGGPITTSGSLSIDPTATQQRVSGSCSGSQAVQTVNQNGTVGCSSVLLPASTVQTPSLSQVFNGNASNQATLFSGNGISIINDCSDPAEAKIVLRTDAQTTANVLASIATSTSMTVAQNVAASSSVTLLSSTGSPVGLERGEFNAGVGSGPNVNETVSGSYYLFRSVQPGPNPPAGSYCQVTAFGIVS